MLTAAPGIRIVKQQPREGSDAMDEKIDEVDNQSPF